MISIYLKTHNKTGLKYLGQTKHNPLKYNGSGTYWLRHLNVHGLDITTEILFQSENLEEIKREGIRLSKELNIVKSKEFANLMIEKGDGGTWNSFNNIVKKNPTLRKEISKKISEGVKKAHKEGKFANSNFGKTKNWLGRKHSERTKKKMSENSGKVLSKEEFNSRIEDYNNIEKTYGYISILAKKWNISHTQVRRFILKNNIK